MDGLELDELLGGVVVEIVVGIRKDHVRAQCQSVPCHLKKIKKNIFSELCLIRTLRSSLLPKYSFVAAAANAISSSKLLGLQL